MELYRQIGERIRTARAALGISQEDLAREMGYASPATISHFETGQRKIGIDDLSRIAEILGLPLEYLIGEVQSEAKHFQLRASKVKPSARESVAAFLSFARKHGGSSPPLLSSLRRLRPGGAADRLLAQVGIVSPPVSPREVAGALNVPVFQWDFPDEVSGILVLDTNAICIGFNQFHPSVRQRFTVAHELGHLVYSGGRELFLDFTESEAVNPYLDDAQRELEVKANQFAADLLMPRRWVVNDARAQDVDALVLARRYEVSEQAMWFRLINLKLVQEMALDSNAHGQTNAT